MRKYIYTLLLLSASAAVFAAVPDNDDVYTKTADASSPYYYPNLKMKFDDWSAPMGDIELHYLYYGYAFTDSYRPLGSDPHYLRVMEIMSRLVIDEPMASDLDELIMAASQSLEHDPFSPRVLNIMAYAYGALGDTARERAWYERMNGILRVIESSGDGLRKDTPMHIISLSHGEDVIASRGWGYAKSRIISRDVEYMPLDTPHDKIKGLYFNYSRVYWNKPENYTFRRERTWQFNNLKPREYK